MTGILESPTGIINKQEHEDSIIKADLLRSEAIKCIAELNVNQSLRRALLRKTKRTGITNLTPGDRCAFWRWRKVGTKKRGAWTTARFLSWDSPGKTAWVRSGHTTILVTSEQLRAAVGFEQWTPSEEDIRCLKDASKSLKDTVFEDERGDGPDDLQDPRAIVPRIEPTAHDDFTGTITDSYLTTRQPDRDDHAPVPAPSGSLPHSTGQQSAASAAAEVNMETIESLLPAKRPFETMHTLLKDEDGEISRTYSGFDGSPDIGFGKKPDQYYKVYLNSDQRTKDVPEEVAHESDSSADSDGGHAPEPGKNKLTRQELKQLDREVPWREIISSDKHTIDKYIHAIEVEEDSWVQWGSIRPLDDKEATAVLADSRLRRRVMKSRAAYRDKNRGQGELKSKCRIVCIGCNDPDLASLSRDAPLPGRPSEHILYSILVAGLNREFTNSGKAWRGWTADAATAFLQGDQPDDERTLPLFMWAPDDPLIRRSGRWTLGLYQVIGNIYGLTNAPRLWGKLVSARIKGKNYRSHKFDPMLYVKYEAGEPVSIILVYVDDFIGVYREDYENIPVNFKGKEFTVFHVNGRFRMKITQTEFIDGLDEGRLPRGEETDIYSLKMLYDTIAYLNDTKESGITLMDVPVTKASVVLTYTDSSWANAHNSSSQFGVITVLTTAQATQTITKGSVLDWRSGRSSRVCRSTLAAEASAADEGSDRAAYLNMMLSELLYNEPAHRIGCRLANLQATDAKSLYDCIVAEGKTTSDKRSMVNIRAIQETVAPSAMRWVPTQVMWADGLTKVDPVLRERFRAWLQEPLCQLREALMSNAHAAGCRSLHVEVTEKAHELRNIRWLHFPKAGTSFISTIWNYACARKAPLDLAIGKTHVYDFALMSRYPSVQYCHTLLAVITSPGLCDRSSHRLLLYGTPCVNRCRRTHRATEFRSLSSAEPSDDNKPVQADLPHQQGCRTGNLRPNTVGRRGLVLWCSVWSSVLCFRARFVNPTRVQ
ncbi:unnamed protein product [Effrenium voratum]|nr:unnamed protein product [Effrenium voratum]